ncbi:hypothetical protein HPB51_004632 [Rhipicephalus microplus]|uniref:Uncharacterized protein n=1 Tax=Rhipicephalus microplus TaxID=6941 RepID=A0A9J6DZZ6_RHIMP|nr:hypothetical protein HPB51_004632 [Rhipicephalus microplus]
MCYLFNCIPARRVEYARITGSIYPLKFYAVRWIENVRALWRALEVLSYVKTFVELCQNQKKWPTSVSYAMTEKAIRDPQLFAKLSVMFSVTEEWQSFLVQF